MKKRGYLLNLVASLALIFAKVGAGTNCWFYLYQPELPEQLRKEA